MRIQGLIEAQFPRVADLRHRLHQIPELGYREHKTAAAIRAELDSLQIAWQSGPATAPTATIAMLGDPAKTCIALRADIDALPITERTDLPYASTHAGRMHACGHDGHTANLMGVAAVFKSVERELPVCVKLIWQPAEEGGGGAERLVKAGILDGRLGPKVSAIFGLHGWPGLHVGAIATRPGALLAGTDNFTVTFTGQGCHGGYPHLGHDPIPAVAEAILSLQHIVSREIDPTESAVVTVGTLSAGTAVNIIPDSATFSGTSRTLNDETRRRIEQAIRRRCAGVAAAHNCALELDWRPGYPPTVNDPAMADFVADVARKTLGPDRFLPVAHPSMGAEDFAYYLQQIPGCFFFVGVQPEGAQSYPSLHSDRYDFTDAALPSAMAMFVNLVLAS